MTKKSPMDQLSSGDAVRYEIQVGTGAAELDPHVLKDLPSDWTSEQSDVQAVWISAFTINAVTKGALIQSKTMDVMEARLIFGFLDVSYLDTSRVGIDFRSSGPEVVGEPKERKLPNGPRLLVLLPMREDPTGRRFSTDAYIDRVEAIVGIAFVFGGRSIAYRKLFENVLDLRDGSVNAFVGGENPVWHGPPKLTNLQALEEASRELGHLKGEDRRRIELSLRWFAQATYETGTDAFIRYWVSIETLAMPNTSNIRPLEEAVATAYGIDLKEARDRFRIGRVYDLRNNVIHQGEVSAVTPALLSYVQALYQDVLNQVLGRPTTGAAAAALNGKAQRLFTHYGWQ